MDDEELTPVMNHLFGVTIAARDAFTRAALTVRSPGLAALFLERAEDQARIAMHLRDQVPARQ